VKGKSLFGIIFFLLVVLVTAGWFSPSIADRKPFAFLFIPGITGESEDPAHRNWIEVISCNWGSVPPPRGSMVPRNSESPAGKLCFGRFSILKPVDTCSRILARSCSRGVRFSHVRMELTGQSMGKYRFLVLRKVKVLSIRPGTTLKNGTKTEIVTLGFQQVVYQ